MSCIISNCHLFDLRNNKFCELYSPTEHLTVDEVIMLYKGRGGFWQYILIKHKRFGIKIYKLCDSLGYNMSVYLVKRRQHYTVQITATHGTVLQVIRRVEGLGHKIFMDNYFTLSAVFGDLFQWKINACGTVCHDKHGIPWDNGPKSLKMKKGGHSDMSQGNPKGCSLERQAGWVHSVKHACSPCWRKFHSRIWPGYQTSCCRRLQCLHGVCGKVRQNGQQLWNCPQNMEVDQESVFHLTDMTILNLFLIHKSCGGKMTHKNFHEILVRKLIIHWQQENLTASGISRGRISPTAVSRVFASQTNTEHAVFLKAVWRSVHSELLLEVAYAFELESLDTKRSFDCVDVRQIISLCSAGRKHLLCK